MSSQKWVLRSYHLAGEKVEEFASEAEGWAAAKQYLANGVAVAGPTGPLADDDKRSFVKKAGMVVDDVNALDKMFTKW